MIENGTLRIKSMVAQKLFFTEKKPGTWNRSLAISTFSKGLKFLPTGLTFCKAIVSFFLTHKREIATTKN